MKKIILSAFAGLLLFSCGVTKKSSRTDKTESDKTVERRTFTRPGDTISIDIPNIHFKDTTITRTNYETRTVASVHYDSQGNARFDCMSAELREEMELIRETIKNDVKDDNEVESEFKPQHFIYALAVLVGVIIIAMIVGMVAIAKIKKSIPDAVTNILKDVNK